MAIIHWLLVVNRQFNTAVNAEAIMIIMFLLFNHFILEKSGAVSIIKQEDRKAFAHACRILADTVKSRE